MPKMNTAWCNFVGAPNAMGPLEIGMKNLFWWFANENNVWKQTVVLMIMIINSAVLPT